MASSVSIFRSINKRKRKRKKKKKKPSRLMEAEQLAKCECCGLTEEYTATYITRERDRHLGHWICGLCSTAVDDEIRRSGSGISIEEALDRHMSFSRDFLFQRPDGDSVDGLIVAVAQLLRRRLESRRRASDKSGGCFPAIVGWECSGPGAVGESK